MNWEVLVIDEPIVNAFCIPGGKIIVLTGLLDHFRTDAEIATIISHEVGHVVARHGAEQMSNNMWFKILQIVLMQFVGMPDLVNMTSQFFLKLPFSRGNEMEADYIGVLLLASAGFDPRVAPQVYEKLGEVAGDTALNDYLATHPSGKKRALVLSRAKVMIILLHIQRIKFRQGCRRLPVRKKSCTSFIPWECISFAECISYIYMSFLSEFNVNVV
ncbi:hypothetical protein MKW92_008434 [Papaver armeniacum]|nr:hypothetical protein MKW92_008434 [Papaver armeniacum]